MSESKFALNELSKYGWKNGCGLGRQENGIKEAIRVKYKFDSKGVGHDEGKEYSFHWWDHVFNKAANSIQVQTSDDGVEVRKTKNRTIAEKKSVEKKNALYGYFSKGATLQTNEDGLQCEMEDVHESSSHSEDEECLTLSKISEEEIFKKCGGRTAHKGARHGLKLNGKLLRIQEQEKQVMERFNANHKFSDSKLKDISAVSVKTESRIKKKKKKRENRNEHEISTSEAIAEDNIQCNDVISELHYENTETVYSKKRKKKRKNSDISDSREVEAVVEEKFRDIDADEEEENVSYKPKKKKRKNKEKEFPSEGQIVEDKLNYNCVSSTDEKLSPKSKKKKKKKKKSESC